MSTTLAPRTALEEGFYRLPLASIFARDRYLLPLVHRMQDHGVTSIGDLLKTSQSEIFAKARAGKAGRQKIRNFLSEAGLEYVP